MTKIESTSTTGFLKVKAVKVSTNNLQPHTLEYLDRPDSVAIMLKTTEGNYVLVEQFRIGPASKVLSEQLTLEPVAGMVDKGENPETAVRRECVEEIGVDPLWTTHVESFWMCPGVSNEKMHLYIGMCDTPNDIGGTDEFEHIVVKQFTENEMLQLKKEKKLNTPHALILWNAWCDYNAELQKTQALSM